MRDIQIMEDLSKDRLKEISSLSDELFELVGDRSEQDTEIGRESLTFWQDVGRRLLKNRGAILGLFSLILIIGMALGAPSVSKYSYDQQIQPLHMYSGLPPKVPVVESIPIIGNYFNGTYQGEDIYEARGVEENFFFGTDELGRDQWVRVWYGVRISLLIAFIAATIDFLIGVTYGGISGYFGGHVDMLMQRFAEILAGIPGLVVIILFILVLRPGIIPIALSLAITGWIGMSRVVRAQVLKLKEQEFVMAARTLGTSDLKIIMRHLLPNTVGQIVIMIMFTLPGAIFYEAFLAFIGLGLPAPKASLGVLVNDGFQSMFVAPYLLIIPAIIISLLMLSFNMLADGLRDALDPKMKKG